MSGRIRSGLAPMVLLLVGDAAPGEHEQPVAVDLCRVVTDLFGVVMIASAVIVIAGLGGLIRPVGR